MKIGVVGAGQLARMLALAGVPLGLELECLGSPDDPAAAAALVRPLPSDEQQWRAWLRSLDVLTFEHENLDFTLLERVQHECAFVPSLAALRVGSDRLLEKQLFSSLGLPTAPYCAVSSVQQLRQALQDCGAPGFVKLRRFGFDGRGQALVSQANLEEVWARFSSSPGGLIYEAKINFNRELSQLLVCSAAGERRCYPLSENHHRHGILWQARCLAGEEGPLALEARRISACIASALGYVGVMAVELFEREGQLWVNEIAPRVHNSGHWSIEASTTSQFENHLRAVAGLPLGSCASRAALMLNCLGRMPDRQQALAIEGLHYHDYAKSPRPQRKVGHLTLLLDGPDAAKRVEQAQAMLVDDAATSLV